MGNCERKCIHSHRAQCKDAVHQARSRLGNMADPRLHAKGIEESEFRIRQDPIRSACQAALTLNSGSTVMQRGITGGEGNLDCVLAASGHHDTMVISFEAKTTGTGATRCAFRRGRYHLAVNFPRDSFRIEEMGTNLASEGWLAHS